MNPQLSPMQVDLVISAKWIATVSGAGVLTDHSVVVQDKVILDIVPTSEVANRYHGTTTVALDQHILTPGFINTHGHAAMTLFRGYADDLPLMTWLNDHIWPNEAKWLSGEFAEVGAQLAIAEMIRGGTTFFSDNYFFTEQVGQSAIDAGIRAQLCPTILNIETAWAKRVDDYLAKAVDTHHRFASSDLVNGILGPHSPYVLSDQDLEQVVSAASDLGCMIQMHVHETEDEITDSLGRFFCRPLARLDRVGMLTDRLQAVHMTQLTEHEIELLGERNTKVIHCPESNLKLASGFCPVGALRAANVTVALGTDGAASNNDLDMLGETRTASLLAKAVAQDATELSAEAALKMATLEGAKALGMDEVTGSIEIGKSADLCATSLSDFASMPVYNPVSQLVYTATRDQVTHVWVAGKALLSERSLLSIDTDLLTNNVRQWRDRIAG